MNKISLLAIAALPLILTGCGSGSPHAKSSSSTNAADQGVKFAQCMRQHGVPMADPTNGQIRIQMTGGPQDQSKMDAAQQACKQYAPKLNQAGGQSAQDRDHALKLAECLRKHGFNVPDPQPGQGMKITSTGDPQSGAKIDAAMKTCQQEAGR